LAFSARAAASLADASLDCASLAAFLAAASLPGRESLHGGNIAPVGGKTMVFEAPRMVGNHGKSRRNDGHMRNWCYRWEDYGDVINNNYRA